MRKLKLLTHFCESFRVEWRLHRCWKCCHMGQRCSSLDRDHVYHLHLSQSARAKKKTFSSIRAPSVRNQNHSNKLFSPYCRQSVRSLFFAFCQRKPDNRICFSLFSIIFNTLEAKNVCEESASLWWSRCVGLNLCVEIQRAELGKQVYLLSPIPVLLLPILSISFYIFWKRNRVQVVEHSLKMSRISDSYSIFYCNFCFPILFAIHCYEICLLSTE